MPVCLLAFETRRKRHQNLRQGRNESDPRGGGSSVGVAGLGAECEGVCEGPDGPHTVTAAYVTAAQNHEPDRTQELQFPSPFWRTSTLCNITQQN